MKFIYGGGPFRCIAGFLIHWLGESGRPFQMQGKRIEANAALRPFLFIMDLHPRVSTDYSVGLDSLKYRPHVPMQFYGLNPFARGQIRLKFAKTFLELKYGAGTIAVLTVIAPY